MRTLRRGSGVASPAPNQSVMMSSFMHPMWRAGTVLSTGAAHKAPRWSRARQRAGLLEGLGAALQQRGRLLLAESLGLGILAARGSRGEVRPLLGKARRARCACFLALEPLSPCALTSLPQAA